MPDPEPLDYATPNQTVLRVSKRDGEWTGVIILLILILLIIFVASVPLIQILVAGPI